MRLTRVSFVWKTRCAYLTIGAVCGAKLSVVVEFAQRDPTESAHNHVRAASEEAYFYAGLAFGLTFVDFRSIGTR